MRSIRLPLIGLLILIIPLTSVVWFTQNNRAHSEETAVLPTLMPTAALLISSDVITTVPIETISLPPTFTPAPTMTPAVTAMPTLSPTNTLEPSPTPELTTLIPAQESQATAVLVESTATLMATPKLPPSPTPAPPSSGRACPQDVPAKPEYNRYTLAPRLWPSFNENVAVDHFWMIKPFPGGGRFLTNQDFPYGFDMSGRLLLHNGVDAAEPHGTPLLAVADGTVVVAQDDMAELYGWRCNWYGHLVVIELDQTWLNQPVYALYGHVLEIKVETGQRVKQGEEVAEVGFGGAATVPHLHFEVRVGENLFGDTRNPALWIQPSTRGVIAGRLLDPEGRPWQGVGLSLIGRSEDTSEGNTWSYIADPLEIVRINPDEGWAENFVFADVKPGRYDVYTKLQGVDYFAPVEAIAGQVSMVEIVSEPYKTLTPAP